MSGEPGPERIPWARFDVVEMVGQGHGRARWIVLDHLTKQSRFPLDPFNKVQAFELALTLEREARKQGEPLTVLRWSDAVPKPKPEKAKAPPKGNKRREHA